MARTHSERLPINNLYRLPSKDLYTEVIEATYLLGHFQNDKCKEPNNVMISIKKLAEYENKSYMWHKPVNYGVLSLEGAVWETTIPFDRSILVLYSASEQSNAFLKWYCSLQLSNARGAKPYTQPTFHTQLISHLSLRHHFIQGIIITGSITSGFGIELVASKRGIVIWCSCPFVHAGSARV